MKKQTNIAKTQYHGLGKVFSFNKNNKIANESLIIKEAYAETLTLKKHNKTNLNYSSRCSFYKYNDTKKFDNLSFKSKMISF